jgi:YVTN family beta-propeller protein
MRKIATRIVQLRRLAGFCGLVGATAGLASARTGAQGAPQPPNLRLTGSKEVQQNTGKNPPTPPPVALQQPTGAADLEADDPADEERLNRELWESIKKTPYAAVKERVARAQRTANKVSAELPLPNGWKLAPAGASVGVGRFPYEAIAYAGHIVVLNTGYYTGQDKPEISIVDPATNTVVRTLHVDSLFPSAQIGADGDLYLSGGVGMQIVRINSRFEIVRTYTVGGYTGGLAALDANHLVVTYLVASETPADFTRGKFTQGRLAILNTQTGLVEKEVATGYFPYALQLLNGKLYVAVQGENTVQVFSPQLQRLKTIPVGRSPQSFATAGSRLYVVNANDDTVSVLDTAQDRVVHTLSLRGNRTRFGGAPSSCAIDGDRLYVTMTNINAVAVVDTRSSRILGSIPTGWYPTKVLVDRDRLFTLSAKGIEPRKPNPRGPQPTTDARNGPDYVLTLLKGALTTLPRREIDANLKRWTQQVKNGSPLLDPAKSLRTPIRHIFYIVRENRTYDQVMGDIPGANGDPTLTLFGEDVTPNAHRYAREFVTLDNYYADGEISVLGHSFTTSGYASPFLEWLGNAAYSGKYRGYPFGTVPAVTSPSYLWDALDARHVDYRIYGENYFLYTRGYKILQETFGPDSEIVGKFRAQMMTLASQVDRGNAFYQFARKYAAQGTTSGDAHKLLDNPDFVAPLSLFLCGDQSLAAALKADSRLKGKFAAYLARYPFAYRSWDLSVSDLDRAQAWKVDFERQVARGQVAQLHYLWLPNDHTAGASVTPLPPLQLVAQNDAALGRIVETIANSPIWNESLILVTEDDAQNGPDHVDATRTVALAIGPSVRRGAIVHDRYDQLSLLRTIEVLLGLSPLHRGDALAVPMLGIFGETANDAPPPAPQASAHLSPADRLRFEQFRTAGTAKIP